MRLCDCPVDWYSLSTEEVKYVIEQVRKEAPTLSTLADAIAANTSQPLAADWISIIQLLQGLLLLFRSTCGEGETPEGAAAWIRNRPAFGFRRMRLRRVIRQRYTGDRRHAGRIEAAIENECDRVQPVAYAAMDREANVLEIQIPV